MFSSRRPVLLPGRMKGNSLPCIVPWLNQSHLLSIDPLNARCLADKLYYSPAPIIRRVPINSPSYPEEGTEAGLVNRTGRDGRRDNNIHTLRRNDSRADEVDLVSHKDDDGRRRWQLGRRRDCCCCCRRRLSSCPSAMTGRRARQ